MPAVELLGALLLALPTIFIAAFLAATLESARERLRTRRWVMRNLRDLADRARPQVNADHETAFSQWLAASGPDELTDETWRRTWFVSGSDAPDLGPLLRGEAATAVPAEVFIALRDLEDKIAYGKLVDAHLNETFARDVVPLWYERRAPLSGTDRRRVEWFSSLLAARRKALDDVWPAVDRFRAAVAAADGRKGRTAGQEVSR